jgi:hypothetical protein
MFERNTTTGVWEQKDKLKPPQESINCSFGNVTALSGKHLIVGDYLKSYFYERIAGKWTLINTFDNSVVGIEGFKNIAVDRDFSVIGSPLENIQLRINNWT